MRRSLTIKDKKDLRNQCRLGFSISLLFFILSTIIGVTIYALASDLNLNTLNTRITLLISFGTLTFSIILFFLINHKYYKDLLYNEKIQELKTLINKSETIDYATVGMSRAYINRYEFIIDNTKFRVEQELFESCSVGDKLIINYAPKSKYLLSIEKK